MLRGLSFQEKVKDKVNKKDKEHLVNKEEDKGLLTQIKIMMVIFEMIKSCSMMAALNVCAAAVRLRSDITISTD